MRIITFFLDGTCIRVARRDHGDDSHAAGIRSPGNRFAAPPRPRLNGNLMNANFEYLCYGLMAAWLIVTLYVILLGLREGKLRKELDRVRQMVEPRPK